MDGSTKKAQKPLGGLGQTLEGHYLFPWKKTGQMMEPVRVGDHQVGAFYVRKGRPKDGAITKCPNNGDYDNSDVMMAASSIYYLLGPVLRSSHVRLCLPFYEVGTVIILILEKNTT